MNQTTDLRNLILSLLILLAILLSHSARGNSFRSTWTSIEGVSIEARLLGKNGDHYILDKDGRHYQVPPGRLTPESRAKAERLLASPATPTRPSHGNRARMGSHDKHGMPDHARHVRERLVRTTAYTHSESDHLVYGRMNAIGSVLKFSPEVRSAAADWSRYPVGTTFRVKGVPGLHVVDDYGSALVGTATIDLYQPSRAAMNRWGCRKVEIEVVKWGSFERSARILASRSRHAHCRQMLLGIRRVLSREDLQASR